VDNLIFQPHHNHANNDLQLLANVLQYTQRIHNPHVSPGLRDAIAQLEKIGTFALSNAREESSTASRGPEGQQTPFYTATQWHSGVSTYHHEQYLAGPLASYGHEDPTLMPHAPQYHSPGLNEGFTEEGIFGLAFPPIPEHPFPISSAGQTIPPQATVQPPTFESPRGHWRGHSTPALPQSTRQTASQPPPHDLAYPGTSSEWEPPPQRGTSRLQRRAHRRSRSRPA
jgi:hypothetical protein